MQRSLCTQHNLATGDDVCLHMHVGNNDRLTGQHALHRTLPPPVSVVRLVQHNLHQLD
jgi:hypothetical protein